MVPVLNIVNHLSRSHTELDFHLVGHILNKYPDYNNLIFINNLMKTFLMLCVSNLLIFVTITY